MELRLFNRDKDLRFVRPHRIAFLEWLRAVRHNLYCEWTLMLDKLRVRFEAYKDYWKHLNTGNEFFPEVPSARLTAWREKIRHMMNGKQAAQITKASFMTLRTRGVRQGYWPLVFMLGVALGFGIKEWADDRITIGYDDYKLQQSDTLYDLNALEAKFLAEQANPKPNGEKQYPADVIE